MDTDLSRWDLSAVQTTSKMFDDTSAFGVDLSAWDVSSVTSMDHMFKFKTFQQREEAQKPSGHQACPAGFRGAS